MTVTSKIKLMMMCRLIFYSGERRFMSRKAELPTIESVEFDYVGTNEQFNKFLKSVIKDYITENHLLPDEKINLKKSA
jgi:uncharacterized protein YpmS